jgi:hypothetical protein
LKLYDSLEQADPLTHLTSRADAGILGEFSRISAALSCRFDQVLGVHRCPTRIIEFTEIERFQKEYVSLYHLARSHGQHMPVLKRDLLAKGIRPAEFESVKATFYRRADVEHPMKWSDYVGGRQKRTFERVAVALDNAADRIGLQASLPRWIVNAWTQELDLGISRHEFGDGKACLACLYMPVGPIKSEDERVAEELRLPEAKQEVRELLQTNNGVPENFVQRVATAFAVPYAELQPFVGQPLRSFYQKAICGGMMIGLTGTANSGTAVVPMAFQSALAGLGLAADLVKHAAGLPVPHSTSTRVNLLRPLSAILADPRARDATGRCICCDEDFVESYRRKYGVGRSRSKSSKVIALEPLMLAGNIPPISSG